MLKNKIILIFLTLLTTNFSFANYSITQKAFDYIKANKELFNLNEEDIQNLKITDNYTDDDNGITHIWYKQTYQGIELNNVTIALHLDKSGNVIYFTGLGVKNLSNRVKAITPKLDQQQIINNICNDLGISGNFTPKLLETKNNNTYIYEKLNNINSDPIKVSLFLSLDNTTSEVNLIWEVEFGLKSRPVVWQYAYDAVSGKILNKLDLVIHCNFGSNNIQNQKIYNRLPYEDDDNNENFTSISSNDNSALGVLSGSYRVYPYKVEAPSFGSRQLISNPEDTDFSPFGWHDTDGNAGAEYTITRGNNVYAYQDRNDNNITDPNSPPDGGSSLLFDYSITPSIKPDTLNNAKAAMTNLFYLNNIMHDLSANYGFTEAAGNFQTKNYSGAGIDNDHVLAEAHDGSLLIDKELGDANPDNNVNHYGNANFYPPADGSKGRMQMYLWPDAGVSSLVVNSPSSIANTFDARDASFGPCIFDVTGTLALSAPIKGCTSFTNASSISGKIAVIERGGCTFYQKVLNAQTAGAKGVIIIDSVAGSTFSLGGMSTDLDPNAILIPSIFVTNETGLLLEANISSNINATIKKEDPNSCQRVDACYDNGVIAHEYTHGISTRLTGGPSNSSCLNNAEQVGEGWSDFLTLFLTHKPSDTKMGYRGIGTYSYGEEVDGIGIRNYPYSYDMTVCPYVYDNVKDQLSEENDVLKHEIGAIWCSMLYDLYWNMIDVYGYDNDLYNGNGGNNKTLKLVIEGLKLQSCSPGFIDSRDAILKADSILNGYANKCIIWNSFARRGLGYSARQGSSLSINDQVPAYNLPPSCSIVPPVAKIADIAATICQGQTITFQSVSTGSPTSVSWNFGGGGTPNTSTAVSPVVAFNSVGTYTITLTATNTAGSSSTTKTLAVIAKPNVTVNNATICNGESVTLTATGASTYAWTPGGSSSASITVSPTANITYNVVGIATNTCTDTATSTVTVNTKPTADASSDKAITCTTTSVQIGTAAVAGNTYSWSPSAGLSNANIAQPTATAAGTYSVIVTTTATGCKDTDEVVVTLNNTLPNANAGNDKILTCTNPTAQLNGASSTSGVSFSWAGAGIVSGGGTATPTVNAAGSYTLTVTNPANGCTATDQVVVSSNIVAPTADAGIDRLITCTTPSVQIGTAAVAGNSYSWSPSSGLSNANIAQPTATAAATYTVTVTHTASGCTATDVVVVTANTIAPTVSTSGATICTGQSVQLTATGTGSSYSWTGSGIVSGGNTATPTVNAAGTYTVTATNTVNGCTATATAVVTINNSVPTITVNNATICNGESVTLTASGANTYTWSSGQSGTSITVSPTENTTYTATGSTGCNSGTGSGTVTVNPKPEVSVNTASGCPGSSQTLTASGATTYSWSNGSSGGSISITVGSSNSTIQVVGTSTGCKDTATAQITSLPVPATPSITRIDSLLTCTVTAANYQWYKDGAAISGATSQTYKMNSNGQYRVVVENAEGCEAESAILSVISLPVKNNTGLQGMQIIPNPSKGIFEVKIESSERRDAEVVMYSVSGQKVWASQWQIERGVNSYKVSEEQLPQGVYYMQIHSGEGSTTLRIVIQK